ncbi:MAG TPA: tetratricopeptide repeat protein [Bacteroidia bacterium]|jgi:tetratricopeptide (TPR) repeat protein
MKKASLHFFLVIGSCVFFQHPAPAQKKTDSLKKALTAVRSDSIRARLSNEISKQLWQSGDYDEAFRYASDALRFSIAGQRIKEELYALNNLGTIYRHRAQNDSALELFTRMFNKAEKENDREVMAMGYGNIGLVYMDISDYPHALEQLLKALSIAEELGDKRRISIQYGNIGLLYKYQFDYDKALDYYSKALRLAREVDDQTSIARLYGSIGIVLSEKSKLKSISPPRHDSLLMAAMKYHLDALQLKTKAGNKNGIAITLSYIAGVYLDLGDLERSLDYYQRALDLGKQMGIPSFMGNCIGNIGNVKMKLKRYRESEADLLEALRLGRQTNNMDAVMDWNSDLGQLYAAMGNYGKAILFFRKSVSLRDSIYNAENTRKTVQTQMKYEYEKKLVSEKAEQEKKDELSAAEDRKRQIILWSVVAGLVLVMISSAFIYRGYLEKRKTNIEISKQKQLIEEKQKEILDSIHYARKIQRSLLPSEKFIAKKWPGPDRI